MNSNKKENWQINQLFVLLASISILFTVLKFSAGLIVPLLIAMAISILLSPIFSFLETKKVPKFVSLIILSIVILIPMLAFGGYLGREIQDFIFNYDTIEKEFNNWVLSLTAYSGKMGFEVTTAHITDVLESINIKNLISGLVLQAKSQFSNIFLIFFIVAFMLMESQFLYNKMLKIVSNSEKDLNETLEIIEKIKMYFLIKVKTSLLTATVVLLILWIADIRYALLWSVLAFFLNFIPVIGSFIAAVPAVAMAILDYGLMSSLWVAGGYVAVNIVVGNILEPKIMGKGLGLSALVIFVSMTFWGWMFGPAGMILSVPLTMAMQYLFNQYNETKWFAFMLSDYEGEK